MEKHRKKLHHYPYPYTEIGACYVPNIYIYIVPGDYPWDFTVCCKCQSQWHKALGIEP